VDVYLHKNCVMKIIDGRCIMSIKIEMSKGMENGGGGAVCEPRAETSCENVNHGTPDTSSQNTGAPVYLSHSGT
jgi:hypothetical protein